MLIILIHFELPQMNLLPKPSDPVMESFSCYILKRVFVGTLLDAYAQTLIETGKYIFNLSKTGVGKSVPNV